MGFTATEDKVVLLSIIYSQVFTQSTERSHSQQGSEAAHMPSFLLRDVVWAPGNIPSSLVFKTQSRLNTK